MTVAELAMAGNVLGVVVINSILLNIYIFYAVAKNWRSFIQVQPYGNVLVHKSKT